LAIIKKTTLLKMEYNLDLTQKAVVVALKRRNEYYDVTRKRDDYY